MKNYNQIFKVLLGFCLSLILVNCDSDKDSETIEKTPIPLFEKADMAMIHGDTSKSWRITEVITIFDHAPDTHINSLCGSDDVYTFSASSEDVTIDLGEQRCFESISESERFEARLLFWPADWSGTEYTIILDFEECRIKDNGTFTICSGSYYRLAELSEDRMVFHTAGGEFIGEYNEALVFERN